MIEKFEGNINHLETYRFLPYANTETNAAHAHTRIGYNQLYTDNYPLKVLFNNKIIRENIPREGKSTYTNTQTDKQIIDFN